MLLCFDIDHVGVFEMETKLTIYDWLVGRRGSGYYGELIIDDN